MSSALEIVQGFLLQDDFALLCEEFGRENAHLFDPDSDENKLIYTEKYNEFCEIFESKIENLITENNISLEDFYEACKQESEDVGNDGVVGFLIALQDYDVFLNMMKDIAREVQANQ